MHQHTAGCRCCAKFHRCLQVLASHFRIDLPIAIVYSLKLAGKALNIGSRASSIIAQCTIYWTDMVQRCDGRTGIEFSVMCCISHTSKQKQLAEAGNRGKRERKIHTHNLNFQCKHQMHICCSLPIEFHTFWFENNSGATQNESINRATYKPVCERTVSYHSDKLSVNTQTTLFSQFVT